MSSSNEEGIKNMDSNLNVIHPLLFNHPIVVRKERRPLLKTFWIVVSLFFLWQIFTNTTSSIPTILGATLIAIAALYPFYLWCSGKALGMPIFPLFALTYLWTYGLPLVNNHPLIITYLPDAHLFASITVAGFLVLGTFIWLQFVRFPPAPPKSYRIIMGNKSNSFLFFFLISSILFNMSFIGGWFLLEGGIISLIRGAILGFNVLSVFVLSYRYGTKELSKKEANLFLFLLILYLITNTASLLLVGALSAVLLGIMAFIFGRNQVPWLAIIVAVIFILPLHYGKGEMRAKYWQPNQPMHFVQPWQYPDWYTEWIGYSIEYLSKKPEQKEKRQDFSERSSLMHLLLMAQDKTPREVPYLAGDTYSIIPQLLVPRFLNSNKITSHEGTYRLNIHYGLQTRQDTLTTTIGWGLLNESYANFGLLGCAGLAVILGAGYGLATRWSIHTSILSSRSLFTVLLMGYAFQSEFSAGVYVAALFQSVVPLVMLTFVFMKLHKTEEYYRVKKPLFIE
jgi:hypothetical protein